jgi:hypothetical protein
MILKKTKFFIPTDRTGQRANLACLYLGWDCAAVTDGGAACIIRTRLAKPVRFKPTNPTVEERGLWNLTSRICL